MSVVFHYIDVYVFVNEFIVFHKLQSKTQRKIINELESLFNNNVISSNSCLFNKIKKEVVG